MSNCPHCALHDRVETESAGAADNLRFAEAVLFSVKSDASAALRHLQSETNGCPACISRLLIAALGLCTGQAQMIGRYMAADEVGRQLASVPRTEDEAWTAINRHAAAYAEQIVRDARDLETGLDPDMFN